MSTSLILDELTEALEAHEDKLKQVKGAVRASAVLGVDADDRAYRIGATVIDAATADATGLSKTVLESLLGNIDRKELGRWYISVFELEPRPLLVWADAEALLDEEGYEELREELLSVRDIFGFTYPDEEAVFAYLYDEKNDLGDQRTEVTAFEIGQLWKRRFVYSYSHVDEVADEWISEHDTGRIVNDLYEAASKYAVEVLDGVKADYGRYLMGQQSDQYCYLDRLESHGDLLQLKRRDG